MGVRYYQCEGKTTRQTRSFIHFVCAQVHSTVIDKNECLCLYIGLAEAIYVRPADPNELPMWLKVIDTRLSPIGVQRM